MPFHPVTNPAHRHDSGFTVLEVVIASALSALVLAAVTAAFHVVSTSSVMTRRQWDRTRDIDSLEDLLSRDLADFDIVDTSPGFSSSLGGINVISLTDPSSSDPVPPTLDHFVSYRYQVVDGSWHLVRYIVDGTPETPSVESSTSVARHLAPPPMSWTGSTSPVHAVTLSSSTSADPRLTVMFDDGTSLTVHAHHRAMSAPSTSAPATTTPPITAVRCGGSITIVLNTSSSIWSQGAAPTVVNELTSFINSFRGTPTSIRIVSFDRSAISFYPDTSSGTYVDMLTSSSNLTSMLAKLSALSTTSSSWRNGRNWEDGIWQANRRDSGTILPQLPDLIVFVSDGSPNRNRTNTSTDTDTVFNDSDLTRAITAADYSRSTGSTLLGILLGANSSTLTTQHAESVFGTARWDGSATMIPIDRASVFTRPAAEAFSRLHDIVSLISSWRCGGTVTLQQRLVVNGVATTPTGTWSYRLWRVDSSGTSGPIVQTRLSSPAMTSTTVDLGLLGENTAATVVIEQQLAPGVVFQSATCTAGTTTLSPLDITVGTDSTLTVRVPVHIGDALSCTLTAQTTS